MDNLSCRSIFRFFISESFSRRSFGVPSGLLWSAFGPRLVGGSVPVCSWHLPASGPPRRDSGELLVFRWRAARRGDSTARSGSHALIQPDSGTVDRLG